MLGPRAMTQNLSLQPIMNSQITSLKESSTLAIHQRVKELKGQGQNVVHFGFGQSPFAVPDNIQQALREASHQKEYLPTLGLRELREAFCSFQKELYGYDFHPDTVLVGPGSKELIFQALFVLEGPLLIPAPSWVSYGPQAHIRGKTVHTILTKKANNYKLTPEELEQSCLHLLVNRQKILILNSPNNPTGTVYTDSELAALAEVCRQHGIIVISDEIYSLTNFSGRPHRGFAHHYPEGTITTGGLSKGHSAGGYRLGILAAPLNFKSVIKALTAMVSETYSAVSAPTQYAAIAAYSLDPKMMSYIEQCTHIHRATGHYLHRRFQQMGLDCIQPEGAFYLFPDFEPFLPQLRKLHLDDSPSLCRHLLDKYAVATLPASDFYFLPEFPACRVATVDYDGPAVHRAALSAPQLDDSFVEAHCPRLKEGADRIEHFIRSELKK